MIMCVWGTETEAGTSMEDVDKSKRFHDTHLRGKRSLAAWKACWELGPAGWLFGAKPRAPARSHAFPWVSRRVVFILLLY